MRTVHAVTSESLQCTRFRVLNPAGAGPDGAWIFKGGFAHLPCSHWWSCSFTFVSQYTHDHSSRKIWEYYMNDLVFEVKIVTKVLSLSLFLIASCHYSFYYFRGKNVSEVPPNSKYLWFS